MALTVKKLVNRHGALVSAVAGLLVGASIVVLNVAQHLVGLLGGASQLVFGAIMLTAVPFAVGYFLALWIIAPIADELRLPHVITRSILATGVASTVVFVVLAVSRWVSTWGFASYLLGDVPGALGSALVDALLTFVANLPLGILAGVLLWLWRKDHPPREPLSGLIDEV